MRSKIKFGTASMMLGIFSITTLFFGISVILGALGIIFAMLSRDEEPLQGRAIAGFVTSIIGLTLGFIILLFISYFLSLYDIQEIFEDYYDIFYEEYNEQYEYDWLDFELSDIDKLL